MQPRHGLRIWIGGYPPPPGWDRGMALADGWAWMVDQPQLIEAVCVGRHDFRLTKKLADLLERQGHGKIAVEVWG